MRTLLPLLALLLTGAGGTLGPGAPGANAITAADLTNDTALHLFVDPLGNDGNACTGTGTAACLTCNGALNKIPKRLRAVASVTLAAGTYVGCNVEGFSAEALYQTNTDTTHPAMLMIQGTLIAYVPATGVATGTFASGTAESATAFATGTVTAAGFTVNDLAGRILHTLAGTGSGQFLQIASNTATVMTFAGTVTTVDATTTFEIVTPGTIINAASAPGIGAVELSNGTNAVEPTNALNILIRYIRVTGAIRGMIVNTMSRVTIQNCRFENTTISAITQRLENAMSNVTITRNAFVNGAIQGVTVASGGTWDINGNYGLFTSGNFVLNGGVLASVFTSKNYMAGGNSFAGVGASGNLRSTRDRVAAASAFCINIGSDYASTDRSSVARASVINGDFSNCASGAFNVNQGKLYLNTTTGTGNTGYGITANYGATVEITSGTTVTGTTGDTLIDGTAYTYAAIRALVPKAIHNLSYGTTVYER